jgi:hypothetical protein
MLKKSIFAASVAALVLLPGVALSHSEQNPPAVPTLNGTYMFTGSNYCQPVVDTTTGDIVNQGEVDQLIGTLTLNAKKGTFALSTTLDSGGALTTPGTGLWQQKPLTANGSFSNTATTLTINGTVSPITYGVVKKGVAQSAVFMNLNVSSNNANCTSMDQIAIQ